MPHTVLPGQYLYCFWNWLRSFCGSDSDSIAIQGLVLLDLFPPPSVLVLVSFLDLVLFPPLWYFSIFYAWYKEWKVVRVRAIKCAWMPKDAFIQKNVTLIILMCLTRVIEEGCWHPFWIYLFIIFFGGVGVPSQKLFSSSFSLALHLLASEPNI